MLCVVQQDINMLDNNIPDNDEPIWDSDTTYSENDKVQYNNYIYISLADNNAGNNPDESLEWFKDEPINRFKCLDGYTDTKTSVENQDIFYKFSTNDIDYVCFFGLYAKEINVKLKNNNDILFEKTIDLERYDILDWWEWTYNEPIFIIDIFVNITAMVLSGDLEITITKRDNKCEVGAIVFGRSFSLGLTQYKAKVSRRTVIKKERDKDGRIRASVGIKYKRASIPVLLDNTNIDTVLKRLEKINGIPAVFIGDERGDGFESLLIYGIYKDFDIAIDLKKSVYDLEIEGVG